MIFFFPPFVFLVVYVLVGAWYREKLRQKYRFDVAKMDSLASLNLHATEFDTGLFDCFNGHKSVRKCCFACWCAPIRWSTDASATGFMEFWIALILTSIFISVMFLFGFVGRIHMRATYGMERSAIADFFSWLCCYSCALTQEGKFVDNGFRALRDGQHNVGVESQEPPYAEAVSKTRPDTPGTEAPPTPPASPSGTAANVQQS